MNLMKIITTCILCAILLTAQNKGKGKPKPPKPPPPLPVTCVSGSTISMAPSAWCLSLGALINPTPTADGWSFAFPTLPNAMFSAATNGLLAFSQSQTMSMAFRLTANNATFYPSDTSAGVCSNPNGQFVLYIQHANDTTNPDNWRWWGHPVYVLPNGTYNINGSLAAPLQPSVWSNAVGQYANADSITLAGFTDTLAHVGVVGITFGGGCNFGHGTILQTGAASMEVDAFSVQ